MHPLLPTPPHHPPALIRDHGSPGNPALPYTLPSMSPNLVSLMRPYKPTLSRRHARRPLPPMLICQNTAATTAIMATPRRIAKHSKIKLKNWCVLTTSVASSAERIIPLDPAILLVSTIDAFPTTLAMIDAPTNPPTKIPNRFAPMLPLSTPPYAALSTPSLVVSLVKDPPLPPERNTYAISNPLTTLPIPIIDAACLPSPSRTTTFTA